VCVEQTGDSVLEAGGPFMPDSWCLVRFLVPRYVNTTQQVVAKRRLLACQRLILMGSHPVCRKKSTVALQVLAGAPPLHLVSVDTRWRSTICVMARTSQVLAEGR